TGAVTTLTPGGDPKVWLVLFVLVFGLAIPLAAWIGRKLARPWLRVVGVALGLGGGVANHLLLENDYPGVHFYAGWAAATLLGSSLRGASLPGLLERRAPRWLLRVLPPYSPRLLWPFRAAAALLAGAALTVQPTNAVALELLRLPGSIVAPQLASLRISDFAPAALLSRDEWL